MYRRLAEVPQGLTGAILARGAAQVLRLSLIYALLDEEEATATRYHDTGATPSSRLIPMGLLHAFGVSHLVIVGDPVADRLLRLIKTGPQTEPDLYEAMGKHDGDRTLKRRRWIYCSS